MQSYLQGTQSGVSVLSKPVYWFEFDKITANNKFVTIRKFGFSKLKNVLTQSLDESKLYKKNCLNWLI